MRFRARWKPVNVILALSCAAATAKAMKCVTCCCRITARTRLIIDFGCRAALAAAAPGARIPYLMDPNTGEALGKSADIVRYLFDTYGCGVRGAAHAG